MTKEEFTFHIINYFKNKDLSTEYGVIEDFKKLYIVLISSAPDEGVEIYNQVISEFMDKEYFVDRNGEAYFTEEGIKFIKEKA